MAIYFIILGVVVVVVLILGAIIGAGSPVAKKIVEVLADEIKKLERMTFDELSHLCKKDPEREIGHKHGKFIRNLSCTTYDNTGGKYLDNPHLILKTKVMVSSKDRAYSDYQHITKKKSLKEKGSYQKTVERLK